MALTIGVLALQGGFLEHTSLLKRAVTHLKEIRPETWRDTTPNFVEVRNPNDLSKCDALIIPGGESTTMALVASQCGLLGPLRQFVKIDRRPTWGTCAGLVLLSEEATATKKGGQELIGGLDVRVQRNHFGRQAQSFMFDVELPFLESTGDSGAPQTFPGVFIRAPIVETLLSRSRGSSSDAHSSGETTGGVPTPENAAEVLATIPRRTRSGEENANEEAGDVVAVRQGNVVGTSFHPELTDDIRMHVWWLEQVLMSVKKPASNV